MHSFYSSKVLFPTLILCLCTYGSGKHVYGNEPVQINVPTTVIAQPVDRSLTQYPSSGGKLVRLRISVALAKSLEFEGTLDGYSIQIWSPNQSMRVLDSWPKTEVYSDVVGGVSVEQTWQNSTDYEASLSAGLEPFARGKVSANHGHQGSTKEKFQRQPKLQTVASSGIAQRGYGVFFQFHASNNRAGLQGTRELAVLAEVPKAWRADVLIVEARATGKSSRSLAAKTLSAQRMWVAVHQEGDAAAAAQVRNFWNQERSLRALAASRKSEVKRKATPTIFHQIGVALDMVEPRIAENYLEQVLYGPSNQYLEGHSHRLPIDLKIAILDFWEQREGMADLAFGQTSYLGPGT